MGRGLADNLDADDESIGDASSVHPGQLTVAPDTVRRLIDEQFPALRHLPIRPVASPGTVNAFFRIGDRLAARFPLEPGEVNTIRYRLESEAAAAFELARPTRFPTPEPVALASPGRGHPLPRAVQTWLPGTMAYDDDPGHSTAFAHDLASFIADLRAIDTRGRTFAGSGRGGHIRAGRLA